MVTNREFGLTQKETTWGLASYLVLPVPPTLNHRQMIVRGRFVTTPEHRNYKKTVSTFLMFTPHKKHENHIEVDILWQRARKAGDIDGRIKTLFDALNGFLWNDDEQVFRLIISKTDKMKENPCMIIKIMDMSDS